jgi:hypothetical protein
VLVSPVPEGLRDRTIPVSSAAAQQSRTLWNEFKRMPVRFGLGHLQRNAGRARGVEWIEEKDAPVEDLQVTSAPAGMAKQPDRFVPRPDIKVLARGTLDLRADRARIDVVGRGREPASAVGTRIITNAILSTNDLKTLTFSVKPDTITIVDQSVTLKK